MLMPALPLLVAMFIAFASESMSIAPASSSSLDDLSMRLAEGLAAMAMAGIVAMGLGLGITAAVRRRGGPGLSSRRGFVGASYVVQAINLLVFAWIVHGLGWPAIVRARFGLGDAFVIDEILIVAPFLVAELIGWWGLYPAARALRMVRESSGIVDYTVRKARMTYGMTLPAVILFWAGNDLARRVFGEASGSPEVQIGVMAAMGAALLVISPAFVRLTWPASPLPPGPLRDRLDRLARRHGFRYTDILLWDTHGTVFNAVVTGAVPWYRYVLLSDALVDHLDDDEVAAVFGHEMGHIAHRHLAYFGMFFLGSLGVIALLTQSVDWGFALLLPGRSGSMVVEIGKSAVVLSTIGVYYWLVFGALSRRFERQADVFGCRVVSCGRDECPPHDESDGLPTESSPLCAVGILTCVGALATVAAENGIRPDSRSWRHGSITSRMVFLRGLEGRPASERRFQAGVTRLRILLALLLGSSIALAWLTGAFETLRGV